MRSAVCLTCLGLNNKKSALEQYKIPKKLDTVLADTFSGYKKLINKPKR
jgi:hypothetical protein|tara:strand:- start:44 stop:190 length:147 start_codon:yes stop_codon:yes gene_type:complete